MDITIHPGKLTGTITAIPSKSQAHRLLICAAFANSDTTLLCPDTNRDIEATVDCLNALGARIIRTDNGYHIEPIEQIPANATLNCCESGSTLRFLLPVVGALGVDATFQMAGRLPQRPLSPLWEELERIGCSLSRPSENTLRCQGKLQSSKFSIPGNVSSQFITGLLFAAVLMNGCTQIQIIGQLESAPYVTMTQDAMALFGVNTENLCINGIQDYRTPGQITVEGDWSNAAFWLAANALESNLNVKNLNMNSPQGDKEIVQYLKALEHFAIIDASQTPDLVPIMAITAGAKNGAKFTGCSRLRLKETDRLATTAAMINNLGGCASIDGDDLTVEGTGYRGGIVDALNDHRIAMSAAIAATVCRESVTILNAHEVKKSYPGFWEDYQKLGGNYELYLR